MDQCRLAAGLLDDETGWVTGETRPFNRDRYASDRREVVGGALRRRVARSGLDLWENDATLIRSDLLAEHPLTTGRSWGSWLRERRSEGLRGAQVDASLSLRAAPVAAGAYWPDSLARQRASALDVAGGMRTGSSKARCLAALLLLRELYAYPLVVWLLLPVLMGTSFAFDASPWWSAAAVAAAATLRWWSLRAVLGLESTPRSDVLGAVYHSPGSLSALGTVLRGRIGGSHRAAPTRPLVWAALALTAVAGYGLLSHEPGESTSRVAVGLSLVMLAVLWAFTVRSLVERNWSRTSYRVRLRRPATVDGVDAETVDGSPGGVAVRGRFPSQRWPVGSEVQVELHLDDDSTATAPGVVAARRRSRGADLLGLELHPGPEALDNWSAQLLRVADVPAADHTPAVPLQQRAPRRRLARALDRLVLGAVVLTSIAVVGALVLVLLGFRPLVVRSGSMIPTYRVGDIVLVEQIRADELRVGEVVTLAYYPEYGESLTHRVRSIRDVDGEIQVETRGDANESSEVWTVAPDALVGRVVASAPAIGAPATLVRTAKVPLLIGLAVLAVVVAAVVAGGRTRPDPEDPDDPGDADDAQDAASAAATSTKS
jgi:signal peptidase